MMNPIDRRNGINNIKLISIVLLTISFSACDKVGEVVITPIGTTTPTVSPTDTTPPIVNEIDKIAPMVISTIPANGATHVAINTAIRVTFSEPMATTTLTTANFTVILPDGRNIDGTVIYDGATATFTPSSALASYTTFTVRINSAASITSGAKDVAGNPLAADFVWRFTTLDATPPTVILTFPANDEPPVAINTVISATFSEPMATTTLTTETFTVSADGNAIAGTISYVGPTATFTPTAILSEATTFTATITTGAMDLANNPLAAHFSWTFTTAPPKVWGQAARIETNNDWNAYSPQVAMDGNGNAIAVWSQSDGKKESIWANRYTPDTGWDVATLIETNDSGAASYPQVAVDGSGNAIAVWEQRVENVPHIWANQYLIGTGWDIAEPIDEAGQPNASSPQLAMNSSGHAIAVWSQSDGVEIRIWANRYQLGIGWDHHAERITMHDAGEASDPQVAVDGRGHAIAVWSQSDRVETSIWANRYRPGTGWGNEAERIEMNVGNAYYPQVAVDGSGNAIAVWEQNPKTSSYRTDIWANCYRFGTGWGAVATLIETDDRGSASYPQVALDGNGNAIAVWNQHDGMKNNILVSHYLVGKVWGVATRIDTNDNGNASDPQVAMDGSGNAVVAWKQRSSMNDNNILVSHYLFGKVWGPATRIGIDDTGDTTSYPAIAVNSNGNAIAVWRQYADLDISHIHANSFR